MSNTVFVVKNQHDLYLSKQQEWVDGSDSQVLYRTRHRDEAINTVFEVSSRDIYLRAESVLCELDAKGNPALASAEKQIAASTETAELEKVDVDEEPALAIEDNVSDSDERTNQNHLEYPGSAESESSPEESESSPEQERSAEQEHDPEPKDSLKQP